MPVENQELIQAREIVTREDVGKETNLLLRLLFILAVLLGLRDSLVVWQADSIHTTNTDRSVAITRHAIRDKGSLTSIALEIITGVPTRNLYTKISLEDENENEVALLARGYSDLGSEIEGAGSIPVIPGMRIKLETRASLGTAPTLIVRGTINKGFPRVGGWTGTKEGYLDGQGNLRLITGTDPDADTNGAETIATNSQFKLVTYRQRLVTDANPANRRKSFNLDNGSGTTDFTTVTATDHTASQTRDYDWALGVEEIATARLNEFMSVLPVLAPLQAGHRVTIVVDSKQVGDNLGAPQYRGEEWIHE